LAGKRPAATDFGAAAVGTCREIGDGGGCSGDHGPIPAAGKKRRARRSFSASQQSSGRLLAATEDDGHGGCSVTARSHTGEKQGREREHAREREERIRGSKGAAGLIPSLTWASRRWLPATPSALPRSSSTKKTNKTFAKAPLDFGQFPGKAKQHKFWYKSILGICLKLLKTSGTFLINSKSSN
jgi:hypothetical protein